MGIDISLENLKVGIPVGIQAKVQAIAKQEIPEFSLHIPDFDIIYDLVMRKQDYTICIQKGQLIMFNLPTIQYAIYHTYNVAFHVPKSQIDLNLGDLQGASYE